MSPKSQKPVKVKLHILYFVYYLQHMLNMYLFILIYFAQHIINVFLYKVSSLI